MPVNVPNGHSSSSDQSRIGSSQLRGSNPLLFPKSHDEPYNSDLFLSPTSEYRGAPLWSWNNSEYCFENIFPWWLKAYLPPFPPPFLHLSELDKDQLLRQIDIFEEMGFGGFHMHTRAGLETPYLGPEFMQRVKDCVEYAAGKKPQMLACLYDEDKWPSGTAGGLVLKDHPEFRTKHLLLTTVPYGEMQNPHLSKNPLSSAVRSEDGHLLAKYSISFDSAGLVTYSRLPLSGQPEQSAHDIPPSANERIWYAYIESNPPSEGHNGETYVDTLNPKAMERFIELTHEVYNEAVGNYFGSVVPSIFTDEPQFAHKAQLLKSEEERDLFLPWTSDLPETFEVAHGFDILDKLPEILLDTVDMSMGEPSLARYYYHEHVCERFVTAFMDQIAGWCRDHGIALMGHMMQEPTLRSQTESLGEAMRCYRNLDVPGIDILHDAVEYNTAKQASSVSKQRNGARGATMSELYGVTNWTFDFTGYKGSGDWQAALGISFRVPHLTPVTLAGEGKRDYPAAIGYQAPWYKEWKWLEDHFARVNYALTRGTARTRVAVIHPIESFWLCYGPLDRNEDEQIHRMDAFENLSSWLLHGLIDFDFISESLFPEQTALSNIKDGQPLRVGQCQYEAIIVPNLSTIRATTLERLSAFTAAGGKVIVAGSAPIYVDARKPSRPITIPSCINVGFSKFEILGQLLEQRDLLIIEHWGTKAETLLYQMREDGEDRYLFVCNTDRKKQITSTISVRGGFDVVVLDTLGGTEWRMRTVEERLGWTTWPWTFDGAGSLLVRLVPPTGASVINGKPQTVYRKSFGTLGSVILDHVELSERNVLLLDKASWRLAGEDTWQPVSEILRIDNLVRKKLELPLKTEAFRQPWSQPPSARDIRGSLHLRFAFESSEDISSLIELAVEDLDTLMIRFDGMDIEPKSTGWWVDEAIHKVVIQKEGTTLKKGSHLLELEMPFHMLTMVERIYLLGHFGVTLMGESAVMHTLDLQKFRFGDWTRQGLPFYAGNVVYHTDIEIPQENDHNQIAIEAPQYEGPLVTVQLDSLPTKHTLSLHPSYAYLGNLAAGRHTLTFTSFGNRENSFGTLHLPSGKTHWHGPNAWRYEHDWWMEEYNCKPMGLMQAPKVMIPGEDVVTIRRSKVQRWYN